MNSTDTALTTITLKQGIQRMLAAEELPLPSNVSPIAFQNAAVVAANDNPDIFKCTPESVFKSLRRIAGMGLVPDGREAALVPFNTKVGEKWLKLAQAMPMIFGLYKMARNSGEVVTIWAELVYEGETFTVWPEDGERKFDHKYDPLSRKGAIRGAYAVAKLRDGTVELEPMTREEIDKIRAVSKAKNGPAWSNWFTEMAKKSVVRRLCKRLPLSAENLALIMESDSDTIGNLRDVTPRSIQQKIDAAKQPDPVEENQPETPIEIIEPNPDNGFPGSAAWDAGMKAATDDLNASDNPHSGQEADDWLGGFLGAQKAAEPGDEAEGEGAA